MSTMHLMQSSEYLYNKFYRSIGFERREVFEYIKKVYSPKTVLYPGSSIHITPSFYFQHVVYIDNSELSQTFFQNIQETNEIIYQNKIDKNSHYFKFIYKDFTKELLLRENSFDLLISLFSGQQIQYCQKYLKVNGLILATDLFSGLEYMSGSNKYLLIDSFFIRNSKVITEQNRKSKHKSSKLKKTHIGFEYQDNETYFLYKKLY